MEAYSFNNYNNTKQVNHQELYLFFGLRVRLRFDLRDSVGYIIAGYLINVFLGNIGNKE